MLSGMLMSLPNMLFGSSSKSIVLPIDLLILMTPSVPGMQWSTIATSNGPEVRTREAARMGFKRCVLPRTQLRGLDKAGAIELVRVGHLKELLGEIF